MNRLNRTTLPRLAGNCIHQLVVALCQVNVSRKSV